MMAKVHRIHSLPRDAPWDGGMPPTGSAEHPVFVRALDRMLTVQRPAVIAHLRSIRLRHPKATTAQIVMMLERRYLAAVTTGGAAVGATAVVPGIGTGMTLALSGVETAGFLDTTALFAQSLAELHGIRVEDPNRARALVMTLMLGQEGVDLVAQLSRQATGKGPSPGRYWGTLVTRSLPRASVGPLVDRLKRAFMRRLASVGSASVIGKALPFGIGAAVGGAGNHILGRRVVVTSRRAFGVVPEIYPPELEPRPGAARIEHTARDAARRVGGTVVSGGRAAASALGAAVDAARSRSRRRPLDSSSTAEPAPEDTDTQEE